MRLLDKSNLKPDINKLGLIDEELVKLKGLIERPHGIIGDRPDRFGEKYHPVRAAVGA